MAAIDDVVFDLWQIKTEYCRLHSLLEELATETYFDGLPREEVASLVSDLYWCSDLSATKLRGLLGGVTTHSLLQIVEPKPTAIPCNECGESIHAKSRLELQQLYQGIRHVCGKCRAAYIQRMHEKRQEEQKVQWEKGRDSWRLRQEMYEAELISLRIMPYADYLKTEWWQGQRIAALKRSHFACHHNNYSNRGNERARDLIVLCRPCHAKFHDKEV